VERIVVAVAVAVLWGCSGDAAAPEVAEPSEVEAPEVVETTEVDEPEVEPEEAPELFVAEGAPDPRACETDGDCRHTAYPTEDGCCDAPPMGSGAPASGDYDRWLEGYRRDHCADVECPELSGWRQSERCAREIICGRGRCQDTCDGIPDESALPFDEISFREAKRRAIEATTGEPAEPIGRRQRCASRPMDGVIVLGSFAHDRGCRFTGVFVGERYYRDRRAAAAAFLESYDWAAASERERESTAKDIARHLLFVMRNARNVEATTDPNGSVRVDLETVPPSGMRRRREPRPVTPHHFVIDPSGQLH
jgi:hypothetical protein